MNHLITNMESIRNLPSNVTYLKGHNLHDPEIIEISFLRTLKTLDLSGCEEITDISITELNRLAWVENLDLSFCNQITDASLVALSKLPRLVSISLNFCYNLTDSGISELARCKSIESISLLSCEEITDVGAAALADLPNLKNLQLPEFAAISNRTLIVLSQKAVWLESLRLDHLYEISDSGVKCLGNLTNLRTLFVHSCPNVTAKCIAALQQHLPQCHIVFIGNEVSGEH